MIVVRTPAALDRALGPARKRGDSIGFVPTMGALHEGHRALVERSCRTCRLTVASIFVNPLQFESSAEYRRYPRPLQKDLDLLRAWGADVAYCPSRASVLPGEPDIRVSEKRVSRLYEGALRPGHFEGVLTIVAKLFLQVRPIRAFFGEKDFQQMWLIQKMSEELPMGVRVFSVPTVRDRRGLAFSSRNGRLTARGRARAVFLHRALWQARAVAARKSVCRASEVVSAARKILKAGGIRPEYVALVDPRDFFPPAGSLKPRVSYRLLLAARIDGVHLLDNARVCVR